MQTHRIFIFALYFALTGTVGGCGDFSKESINSHLTLTRRVQNSKLLSPKKLFFAPTNEMEAYLFGKGVKRFVDRYKEDEEQFHGYVLHGDPYDPVTDTISFLLGSDCSHFVYRVYEMLGAHYPFAKTRHFIDIVEAYEQDMTPLEFYNYLATEEFPSDMAFREWEQLFESFEIIDREMAAPGDLIVIARRNGRKGRWGHVVLIKEVEPLRVIHAKNAASGIVEENYDLTLWPDHYFFRYRGKIGKPAYDKVIFNLNSLAAN